MKTLGGVIVGVSVVLIVVSWVVAPDLDWLRLTFSWLTVLLLVGMGLLGYGIHLDRKAK